MSTPAKNGVLRAILADDTSVKMITALTTPGKTESKKIALTFGQLTTEQIVNRIKELSKLRDEILQVMRQVSLTGNRPPTNVNNWTLIGNWNRQSENWKRLETGTKKFKERSRKSRDRSMNQRKKLRRSQKYLRQVLRRTS